MTDYTMCVTLDAPYDATVSRVRDLLADAGFGVLTEIDLKATLHAKLGVEIAPQVVLGACRPTLAHEALRADSRVATLLPCNVVVAAEGDGTRVEVLDPDVMTSISPDLADVARDARTRLTAVLDGLADNLENPDATRA